MKERRLQAWWERWGCVVSSLFVLVMFCTSIWWLPYDLHLLGQLLRWLMRQ